MKVWQTPFPIQRGFKSPEAVEEDPDASEAAFEDKDIAPLQLDYDPYSISTQLHNSSEVLSLYEGLNSHKNDVAHIMRSYKHVTLPEFLLYIYLNDNPNKAIKSATLDIDPNSLPGEDLEGHLKIYGTKKRLLKSYTLRYWYRRLHIDILDKHGSCGYVQYIIRGKRIEEIEGRLHNKRILLDPIWNTQSKGQLKEEYIVYGDWRLALIYQANIKHASLSSVYPDQNLSMKHAHVSSDRFRIWVTKSVSCGTFRLDSALVFHKYVLMPISATWTISHA